MAVAVPCVGWMQFMECVGRISLMLFDEDTSVAPRYRVKAFMQVPGRVSLLPSSGLS